jgi:hypothetical protein
MPIDSAALHHHLQIYGMIIGRLRCLNDHDLPDGMSLSYRGQGKISETKGRRIKGYLRYINTY